MPVTGQHEPVLVALSLIIAGASAFTALDLAARMRSATGWASTFWLFAASVAMGGGIWAMHFVGMMALHVPTRTEFDVGLSVLSLAVPLVLTGLAFWVNARTEWKRTGFILSGVVMGSGIIAMHYIGMAALMIDGVLVYDPWMIAVSSAVSILSSLAALYLASFDHRVAGRMAAAVVMGFAVSGMHYTGIEGVSFICRATDTPEAALQTDLAIWVSLVTFAILLLGSLASSLDRRAANAAARESLVLRESEERYRSLYRNTPLPLHSLGPDGRIEQVSDAWLELLGYDRDEVENRQLCEFMDAESAAERTLQDWPALLREAELSEREAKFIRKDGEPVEVLLSASVERKPDGGFIRSVEGLVDVTDRKRVEQALRQAQKMEAVGQLTGGIAHDFNNILMVVGGGLDMIERGRTNPQIMAGMRHSVERATTLTRQLLTFSRRQSINAEVIDPATQLPKLRTILEHSLRPGVELTMTVDPGIWRVEVDAGEMEFAILNLVVNARDAMAEGGTVRVEARNEILDGRNEGRLRGEFVALSVSDTGCGMPPEVMARVFEPFYTTKPPGLGTGLGLSQVYGLARQSAGIVDIKSLPGIGSTFVIYLPRTRKPLPEVKDGRDATARYAEERGLVLVVEDTPSVAAMATALLHELGYDVVHAADATEALLRLDETRGICAVLSDIVMPGGMDGVALAREIRRRRPRMPILLSTGYSREAEVPGEFPVLRKPYHVDALDAALSQVVNEEREPPVRLHA